MANKLQDGTYSCSICGELYTSALKADRCRDDHDKIYLPISKSELNMLIHAIQFGDVSVIPETFRKTIEKYQRANFK